MSEKSTADATAQAHWERRIQSGSHWFLPQWRDHGGETSSQIWKRSHKLIIMSLNENFTKKKTSIWPRWQQPWVLDTSFYNKGVTASSNMIPTIWTRKFVLKVVKTTKVDSFLSFSCFWALSCTCLSFLFLRTAVSALNP